MERTADTPKLPKEEANGEPIPRTTPQALGITMGWEEPSHSTRGAQRAQPHQSTASMTPKEPSAAQIQPGPTMAKKLTCPSSLTKGALYNQRMVEGRDHHRSSGPISLLKQGHPEHIAQGCVQMALEYL